MTDYKNDRKKIIELLVAWAILPLAYFAWCLSTLQYRGDIFAYAATCLGIVTAIVYGISLKYISRRYEDLTEQFGFMNCCIVISGLAISLAVIKNETNVGKLLSIVVVIFWIAVACIFLWKLNNSIDIKKVFEKCIEKKWLFLLIFIVICLSYDNNMYQFKWDGLLYYHAVKEANISSISSVALYGHISQTCGLLFKVFALIVGNTGYGMAFANLLVLIVGLVSFYKVIEFINPKQSDFENSLASACFAFSPYLLGMVNYYSIDYACVCLISFLVLCIIKNKWVLTLPAAIIFCFTKEPALISYCGLCLGLILLDFINAVGSFKVKLAVVLSKIHYYFMTIPVILWLFTYKMLGGWSAGNGGFALNLSYIKAKLAVFYIFNYSWIYIVIFLVGIVVLIRRKLLREHLAWILPLFTSNACLLIFNCMFETANHPRYIDGFISINMILSVGILCLIINGILKQIICAILAMIMLLASFVTYDPISLLFFNDTNIGSVRLLTTNELRTGDSVIYNKQMLWMEEGLNRAFADAIEDNSQIVVPVANNSVYEFDGMSETINIWDSVQDDTLFWNRETKKRVSYEDECLGDDVVDKIKICHLNTECDYDNSIEACQISVIYIKGINDYSKFDGYSLANSYEYRYRGWTIYRDIWVK